MRILIRSYPFLISEPYSPGICMGEPEAQALNALRAENIRNNLYKKVEAEIASLPAGQLLPVETMTRLQAEFTRYDNDYALEARREPGPKFGALEIEARVIGQEMTEAKLRREGFDIEVFRRVDGREAEFQALCASAAESIEAQLEARRRVEARKASGQELLALLEDL